MNFDKKYLLSALSFALIGLLLGIVMGMSGDHIQFVTHAHILLVGFVVSFIYSVIHKLWLGEPKSTIASAQFFLHHVSALVMFVALYLMFGKIVPQEQAGPVLGIASIGVFVGMLLMLTMVLRSKVES